LTVVDLATPATPVVRGTYDTAGTALDVTVVGATAYVSDNDAGLQLIDIANPNAPSLIAGINTPGFAMAASVVGETASCLTVSGLQAAAWGAMRGTYPSHVPRRRLRRLRLRRRSGLRMVSL
jgi:hypothetical protein